MRIEDYLILTPENSKICGADMIYLNQDRAAFIIESSMTLARLGRMKKVRFHKLEEYAEIFEADVYQIKEGRLFVENLKNITATLRSDLKMKVSYKSTLRSLEGTSRKNLEIKARDISCGGMCFETEKDLMMTELYETVVPITRIPLVLNLKILRKTYDEERNIYVYGCRFVELNNNEDRLLREAVYRLQMIARKKIKPNKKEA